MPIVKSMSPQPIGELGVYKHLIPHRLTPSQRTQITKFGFFEELTSFLSSSRATSARRFGAFVGASWEVLVFGHILSVRIQLYMRMLRGPPSQVGGPVELSLAGRRPYVIRQ